LATHFTRMEDAANEAVNVERGSIDFQRVDAKGAHTWTTPSHS